MGSSPRPTPLHGTPPRRRPGGQLRSSWGAGVFLVRERHHWLRRQAARGMEDVHLTDAGGAFVSALPGAVSFDSAMAFTLILPA